MISSTQWLKLLKLQTQMLSCCGDSEIFPQLYFDSLNSFVSIDSCANFLIGDGRAEHIFTEGKLSKATALSLANNYLNLFHKDPAWQDLTGISKQKILWHMVGSSYGSLYKYHFFERHNLIDKVARIENSTLGACSCYLYRRKPSKPFSTADIAMLEILLPFFTATVAKHCEILRCQNDLDGFEVRMHPQDFYLCIEAVVRQRVAPLDILTTRELQVCEQIFKGCSIEQIAKNLKLSVNSVATYRQRAYRRLSIGKIQELFAQLFSAIENWRSQGGTLD